MWQNIDILIRIHKSCHNLISDVLIIFFICEKCSNYIKDGIMFQKILNMEFG